jgi:hypothetical protein
MDSSPDEVISSNRIKAAGGGYSAINRNEYQIFWWVKRGRRLTATILPPSVSRLSRHCGILSISQSYTPPRRITERVLLFVM